MPRVPTISARPFGAIPGSPLPRGVGPEEIAQRVGAVERTFELFRERGRVAQASSFTADLLRDMNDSLQAAERETDPEALLQMGDAQREVLDRRISEIEDPEVRRRVMERVSPTAESYRLRIQNRALTFQRVQGVADLGELLLEQERSAALAPDDVARENALVTIDESIADAVEAGFLEADDAQRLRSSTRTRVAKAVALEMIRVDPARALERLLDPDDLADLSPVERESMLAKALSASEQREKDRLRSVQALDDAAEEQLEAEQSARFRDRLVQVDEGFYDLEDLSIERDLFNETQFKALRTAILQRDKNAGSSPAARGFLIAINESLREPDALFVEEQAKIDVAFSNNLIDLPTWNRLTGLNQQFNGADFDSPVRQAKDRIGGAFKASQFARFEETSRLGRQETQALQQLDAALRADPTLESNADKLRFVTEQIISDVGGEPPDPPGFDPPGGPLGAVDASTINEVFAQRRAELMENVTDPAQLGIELMQLQQWEIHHRLNLRADALRESPQ